MNSKTIFIWLAIPFLAVLLSLPSVVKSSESKAIVEAPNFERVANIQVPTPTVKESWLILPDLPISSTQAEWGAEIYRLVCQDCHGDVGRGLTEEFISTWNPNDQNCWQSKCHATNHPPDGFNLPRYIPAIIGDDSLTRFGNALDLYEYIQEYMPWHNPGSLIEEEYWQLTAYLLRENGINPTNEAIDRSRAESLLLNENGISSEPEATLLADDDFQDNGWTGQWRFIVVIALAIPLVVTALWILRRMKGK